MRIIATSILGFLALTLLWYGAWHWIMAPDVARVKATIHYHNAQFKMANSYVVLKAEEVRASGFPFEFRVQVLRPVLSMTFNRETYAVMMPEILLESTDQAQGRYRVTIPNSFEALYAMDGSAPESYKITIDPVPKMALRAQKNSATCSDFPGVKRCEPVTADAPLISYALEIPGNITAHMELNSESRDVTFTPPALSVPVFMDIPAAADRLLEIAVGVLREALVFKTP
jgi:hypothetical protein